MSFDTPAARRWRKLVDEHAATNLTVRAFAKARGVNPRTFNWWRYQFRKQAKSADGPAFTEVVVAEPEVEGTVVLALDSLPAHMVVDAETDLDLLRRVLVALS